MIQRASEYLLHYGCIRFTNLRFDFFTIQLFQFTIILQLRSPSLESLTMLSMIEDQIGITQLNLLFKNLAQHFKQMGYVDYYIHFVQKKICFIEKKKKILIYLIIFKCIILLSPMFKYLVSSSQRCFDVTKLHQICQLKEQYDILDIYRGYFYTFTLNISNAIIFW